MFCKKCGKEVKSGRFCPNCGTQIDSPSGASTVNNNGDYSQQTSFQGASYGNGQQYYGGPNYAPPQMSGFDGTGAEFFGIYLINALLLFITCGLAYPWVVCRNLRWRKSHTIINGRRIVFTGEPVDLFGKWIIWWILTLITCGIYSFWVTIKMKDWEMSHTCYADNNPVTGQTYPDSFYDGSVGERLGIAIITYFLTIITCGIYLPWGIVKLTKYDMSHSVVNGDRLNFNGTGSGFFGEQLIISILSGITCGIYAPWGVVRLNKWTYKNTHIISRGNRRMYY